MGLSRNKVAVPEGAAGTPPFWSDTVIKISRRFMILVLQASLFLLYSPIAQLVRALH